MSELDDSDILADIRALDEALALNTSNKSVNLQSNSSPSSSTSDNSSDSDDDFVYSNLDIDESLDVYEINKRLIKGLMIAKKKLTVLLQECEQKIQRLDEKINMSTDESSERSKLVLRTAGMPYFKDKDCFSAPKNNDTKLKEARGELFLLNLSKPCRWSGKDREILLKAIHNEAIESVLAGNFNKEITEESNITEPTNTLDNQDKKSIVVLPRNFTEMVGTVGDREFDWYKIAATDFENKHSPNECRSMWNNYLHPDIEKSEWTSAEDKRLLYYAKECKYQDWDTITLKLGTNRSAYQCFIRYNTIKKSPYARRPWSKQEDKRLILVLDKLKIGDYIPWSEVTIYMRQRTKQQIYHHWMYKISSHFTKGRFTGSETNTLMKAVKKYGMDFRTISRTVMPHRSSIQLNGHYRCLIENANRKVWTIDDDKRLAQLHRKYGNEWSKIATHFSTKSRTQLRHRHKALLKYIRRGLSFENIPRKSVINTIPKQSANQTDEKSKNSDASSSNEVRRNKRYVIQSTDILPRLYDNLCFPLSIENTNSQEYYDFQELAHNTSQLYDILKMLNANFNISDDSLNYVHLSRKEKQLLISLKKYIHSRNNRIPNDELIEEFRWRMFGPIPEVSESSHFIPPLPFDGYIKRKRTKSTKSIDCNLGFNQQFLSDMPTEIITPQNVNYFLLDRGRGLCIDEKIQFQKLSQLLISSDYNCNKQNINLQNVKLKIRSKLSCDEDTRDASSRCDKPSAKTRSEESETEEEQSNKSQETSNIERTNQDNKEMNFLSNTIMPNHPTLLGFKNLLLWKLLYEYQYNESHESVSQDMQESTDVENDEYQRAYKMLKTRLLQLFKIPIGLSNTRLHIHDTETVFSRKEPNKQKNIPMKRKSTDSTSTEQNESEFNILTNINSQQNINAKTPDQLTVGRKIYKKYKVLAK